MNNMEKLVVPSLIAIAAILYYLLGSAEKNLDTMITSMCPDYYHVYAFKENSSVYTNSEDANFKWAQGFVVNEDNGMVTHVSKTREELIQTFGKCKKWTDMQDENFMIMPGFIDSHVHIILGGLSLLGAPLRNIRSKEQFISVLKDYETHGYGQYEPWITGGEWNERNWGGEIPNISWTDHIDKPVFLLRMDGHSALINTKALRIAGITKDTPNPKGGTIVRDSNGEPTGILKDKAIDLVYRYVPPMNEDKALEVAMEHTIRYGVTGVHHMGALGKAGGSFAELKTFHKADQEKKLKYRIRASMELKEINTLAAWMEEHGSGSNFLSVGLLKEFYDGSLGSKTALQYTESDNIKDAGYYLNSTDNGLQIHDDEELLHYLRKAEELKLQVAIHAIGEKAVDNLLNLYETVFKEYPPRDRRWRIEHAQQTRPETRKKLGELGILVSVNPAHMNEDAKYVEEYVGEVGCRNIFAFKSLLHHMKDKRCMSIGSDWFVASLNPFTAIDAAVNRVTDSHPEGFVFEERITLTEAVRAHTIGSAYAGFNDTYLGRIEPGYFADFIVVDRNFFNSDTKDIKNVVVQNTFVNGKLVYNRANDASVYHANSHTLSGRLHLN